MRERLCSQLSLPIQSGRVGIRTRVIRTENPLRFDTNRTPQTPGNAAFGDAVVVLASGRTPDSVSLRHLSRDMTAPVNATGTEIPIRSLRQDCDFAFAKTQSTCLAPGWTFTQPLPSLTMLVGFYPTVSPLARAVQNTTRVGFFSVAVVVIGDSHRQHPDLLFRQATVHRGLDDAESREVPHATLRPRATEHLLAILWNC